MNLGVVGLGYVGLPLAVAFSKKYDVIGFDINEKKIENYIQNKDVTNEIGDKELAKSSIKFTADEKELRNLDFIVIAVPTPVNSENNPDFKPLQDASCIVGRNMKRGATIVYESTVYPGATEEICIPILEKYSGFICGKDFKVGYSPERINPGDKVHKLENIVKVVSGIDEESSENIYRVYSNIIKAGVYKVNSIKVAEASKIIENTQRDINIAFMNEIAILFKNLNIDMEEVLKASKTKWNFLNFEPGLVGGHCIGVDPYYLIKKATDVNCNVKLIKVARQINDEMPKYVVNNVLNELKRIDIKEEQAKVAVLGITFKENVADMRNSKAMEIVRLLIEHKIQVIVSDPVASNIVEYRNTDIKNIRDVDIIVIAVGHDEYKDLSMQDIKSMLKDNRNIIYDLKNILSKDEAEKAGLLKISL